MGTNKNKDRDLHLYVKSVIMIKLLLYFCLLQFSKCTYSTDLAKFKTIITTDCTDLVPGAADCDYDPKDPAKYHAGAATPAVQIGMTVEKLTSFNTIAMDYEMVVYLRQEWTDTRLIPADCSTTDCGTIKLDLNYKSTIWQPDIFVTDAKSVTRDADEKLVEVNLETGNVFMTERLTIKMRCAMELHFFPFDRHYCPIEFTSYGYNTDVYTLQWRDSSDECEGGITSLGTILIDQFQPPKFYRRKVPRTCTRSPATGQSGNGEEYPCIQGMIAFHRQYTFYLMNGFFPAFLCVCISFFGFYVKVQSDPARIALGVMTYLALQTQISAFSKYVPKVSYLKAIDTWMIFSYIFVLGTLIEFVTASWYNRKPQLLKEVEAKAKIMRANLQRKQKASKDEDEIKKLGVRIEALNREIDGYMDNGNMENSGCCTHNRASGWCCTHHDGAKCLRDWCITPCFKNCSMLPCCKDCGDLACTGLGGIGDAYRTDCASGRCFITFYVLFIFIYSLTYALIVIVDDPKNAEHFSDTYEKSN